MEGVKKGGNPYKLAGDVRRDRKSATGVSGGPKKGGRGGKFTWEGADGYTDEELDLIARSKHAKAAAGKKSLEDGAGSDGGLEE